MPGPINPSAYYTNNPYQVQQPNQIPPYSPNYGTTYQPPQQNSGMKFTSGVNEARNYPVVPGNTVVLFDANEPKLYVKTVDSFRVFKYVEENQNGSEQTKPDYVTRAEFDELKKMLDDLTK